MNEPRSLAVLVAGSLLIAGAAAPTLGQSDRTTDQSFQEAECVTPAPEQMTWQAGEKTYPLVGEVPSAGVLSLQPCRTARLTLTAEARDTQGRPSELLVESSGGAVKRLTVLNRQTLQLDLPAGQRTLVMFSNDYDVLETRHLLIREVYTRSSLRCPHPPLESVTEGASWNPGSRLGLFSSASSMTFKVCAAGETLLKFDGSVALGRGPQVTIKFEDATVFEGEISGGRIIKVRHTGSGLLTVVYGGNEYAVTQERSLRIVEAHMEERP